MTITKISAAVKTRGRYNVFVDDEFAFSLDESQLVKLGLHKGQTLSQEELAGYQAESQLGKNYLRAVDLIARRPRSEKEIRDYAFRKNWSAESIQQVIRRLYDHGYLDDAKFAAAYVRSRATLKNFSAKKMKLELRKRGINSEIIDQAINNSQDFSETVALKNLIAKKRGRYDDQRKLIAYLARQGFKYDDIKAELEQN